MDDIPCDWGPCKNKVTPSRAVVKPETFGRHTKQLWFCCEDCANNYSLNKLRESGL